MILVARGEGLGYADLLPGQLAASELDNVLVPQGTGYECNSSKCNEGFVRSDKPLQAPRGHLMGANPRC